MVILVTAICSCAVSKPYRDQKRFGNTQNTDNLSATDVDVFLSKIKPVNSFVETQYKTARFLQQRGKNRAAIEVLQEILSIDPQNVKAHNAVGISYDSLSDYSRAEAAYLAALKIQPDADYVHNNLGFSYVLQGKYDSAISAFQQALSLNNENKQYRYNLGLAYARKGQFDAALSQFQMTGDKINACAKLKNIIGSQKKTCEGHYRVTDPIQPEINDKISKSALKDTGFPKPAMKAEKDADLAAIRKPNPEYQRDGIFSPSVTADGGQKAQNNFPHLASSDKVMKLIEKQDSKVLQTKSRKPKYAVQVGAFHNKQYALRMQEKLSKKGWNTVTKKVQDQTSKDLYRVEVCCFNQKKEAVAIRNELVESEQMAGFVTLEKSPFKPFLSGLKPVASSNAKKAIDDIDFAVEISNGNGINRMARRLGYFLKDKGIKVRRLTNADHFNHKKSEIFYSHGYEAEAKRVEKYLPGQQQLRKTNGFGRSFIKLKVVIGKDIIHFDRQLRAFQLKSEKISSISEQIGQRQHLVDVVVGERQHDHGLDIQTSQLN
jgi:tetratricopeptide (TPR) repeat protein